MVWLGSSVRSGLLWVQARLFGEQGQEADAEALNRRAERLLNDHGNSILRLAYSYLHNSSDAEDILQETLIRFLETAPALENEAHEKAWLLRVAANLSKNRITYNRVRACDELRDQLPRRSGRTSPSSGRR